jgi:hypothetical protein
VIKINKYILYYNEFEEIKEFGDIEGVLGEYNYDNPPIIDEIQFNNNLTYTLKLDYTSYDYSSVVMPINCITPTIINFIKNELIINFKRPKAHILNKISPYRDEYKTLLNLIYNIFRLEPEFLYSSLASDYEILRDISKEYLSESSDI